MFVFQPAPRTPTDEHGPSLLPAFVNSEPYKDLFAKWGFLQSGEWSLQAYRYSCVQPTTSPSAMNGAAKQDTEPIITASDSTHPSTTTATVHPPNPVTAAALRFHHGMADDFLRCLFSSAAVQSQLQSGAVPDAGSELRFRPLTCHWNTLRPLRQALVNAKVVRQVRVSADEEAGQDAARLNREVRLPTVHCAEQLLPHGEVISDELRALFLQAHSRKWVSDSPSAVEEADTDSEDSEDDADTWGVLSAAKLPRRQLRAAFDASARREFLYHLLWRLIAGGGALNQFEDDAAVYLDVARQLYRSLLTSFHAREVSTSVDGDAGTVREEADDVAALESPRKPVAETRYEAVVDALVYEVFALPGTRLFPSSDGVAPSNLNYCYAVVNPFEQSVYVWYHHC